MPSSVMLIALRGRPLTVELRAVPDVLKPGSDVSESSALRLVSGRLVICAPVRFVEIDGDCVWTTRALSPMTVTLSSSAPTDSVTFTLAGTRGVQRHGIEDGRLEAHQRDGHRIGPARQGRMVKPPSLPVTVLYSAPVPVFLTLTSAPGMTAPERRRRFRTAR